jgi:hypothetical protein
MPVIEMKDVGTNGGKLAIENNKINHNEYTAIYIKTYHLEDQWVQRGNEIIGNDVLGNQDSHTNPPIQIYGGWGNIISNNKISGGAGVVPILLANNDTLIADYNLISHNICQYGAISNISTGTHNVIESNIENTPQ